jgi:hypothetical protein
MAFQEKNHARCKIVVNKKIIEQVSNSNYLIQRGPIGSPQNYLLIYYWLTTSWFIFFPLKDLEKMTVLILSAALRITATHDIDFKTVP